MGVLDLVFYFLLLLTTNPLPPSTARLSPVLVLLILISVAVFRNWQFRLRNSEIRVLLISY